MDDGRLLTLFGLLGIAGTAVVRSRGSQGVVRRSDGRKIVQTNWTTGKWMRIGFPREGSTNPNNETNLYVLVAETAFERDQQSRIRSRVAEILKTDRSGRVHLERHRGADAQISSAVWELRAASTGEPERDFLVVVAVAGGPVVVFHGVAPNREPGAPEFWQGVREAGLGFILDTPLDLVAIHRQVLSRAPPRPERLWPGYCQFDIDDKPTGSAGLVRRGRTGVAALPRAVRPWTRDAQGDFVLDTAVGHYEIYKAKSTPRFGVALTTTSGTTMVRAPDRSSWFDSEEDALAVAEADLRERWHHNEE